MYTAIIVTLAIFAVGWAALKDIDPETRPVRNYGPLYLRHFLINLTTAAVAVVIALVAGSWLAAFAAFIAAGAIATVATWAVDRHFRPAYLNTAAADYLKRSQP